MNNTSVDSYLIDGCGRCDKFQTPECKVHLWTDALIALRELVLEAGLEEHMKWGSPCYTMDGKNVLMLVSMREFCAISFLSGAALSDEDGVLEKPGPNSRFARYLKFTTVDEVFENRERALRFVNEAIELKRSGKKVEAEEYEPMAVELERRLEEDADLSEAFYALTPGRQRSYNLHISGAKKSETRERRVEKCIPKIYSGKGFNER